MIPRLSAGRGNSLSIRGKSAIGREIAGEHNETSYESSGFPDVPDHLLQLFHFQACQLTLQHRRLRVEAMLGHRLPDALDPGHGLGSRTESAVQSAASVLHGRALARSAFPRPGTASLGLAEISDGVIVIEPSVPAPMGRTANLLAAHLSVNPLTPAFMLPATTA
jgi:hypothetical protein